MNSVAQLPEKERGQIFTETARRMNSSASVVEKDFWVVWVLDKLFSHSNLKSILQFKGGTSLSKIFNLIQRFSEDIDLILDWREVTQEDPYQQRSKTQQDIFNKTTNEAAKAYIKSNLLAIVTDVLSPVCECKLDSNDSFIIHVKYPTSYPDGYLRPEILLEIGPLASWKPSDSYTIRSYAAEFYPELFSNPECHVQAIVAKRTFWEKATILHQEAHRALEKPLPSRYSRHYYDMAMLAKSEIRKEALSDLALLQEVVEFKNRFYPSNWARYDLAKPKTFKLIPSDERIKELKKDYTAMQEMIFGQIPIFTEIMDTLSELESTVNKI